MNTKRILFGVLLIIGIGLIAAGSVFSVDFLKASLPPDEIAKITEDKLNTLRIVRGAFILSGVLLILLSAGYYRFGKQISRAITHYFQIDTPFLGETPGRTTGIDLFLLSFLGLFFEVLIIRWLSTEVRLFAYYKNLPLIAAFIGLGIGFMLARKKPILLPLFPIGFVILATVILLGAAYGVFLDLSNPAGGDVAIWGIAQRSTLPSLLTFFLLIPFFFQMTVLVFIPLGQAVGLAMQPFPPIKAYTINILGSLIGVWGFSLLSFLAWPPYTWFAIGLLVSLWLLRRTPRALLVNAVATGIFIAVAILLRGDSFWSPYYRIDVTSLDADDTAQDPVQWGYSLDVNYDYHQIAVDLSPNFVEQYASYFPEATTQSSGYALPYQLLQPRSVLIVGAGAGNDAATALRHGVDHVDAVEIDPTILHIGQLFHPERPYSSPRVNLIVDDARSYFKKTQNKYDLIVYGLLDSHTLFSSMSSLRLDNFVYTVEGIREARQHLNDNGAMAIYFAVGKDWIAQRLFNIISVAFDEQPLMLATGHGRLFLIGPGFEEALLEKLPPDESYRVIEAGYDDTVELSVDDWPFLYLRDRSIPRAYWQVLALLAVLSIATIIVISPQSKRLDPHFFLLGAAFLLLEIRSITDLALLFGSTWVVNTVVISAILIMILGANYYVQRFKLLPMRTFYSLLVLSLLLAYFFPLEAFLGQNLLARATLGSLVVSLPLFFAGIIFAVSLKETTRIEIVFGSNLLGAVMGGLLEYSSLVLGLKNLMLLALALYIGSYLVLGRRKIG